MATPLKIKIVEGFKIEAGKHYGEIVGFDQREEPYSYLDARVTVDALKREDGTPLTIKYGMHLNDVTSTRSRLAQFLTMFGFKVGEEADVNSLIGRKVEYVTITDDKGYAKIVSIKPRA